jgi:hypothetical protein
MARPEAARSDAHRPSLKAGAFASHDIKRPLPAILRSRRPRRPWISRSPSFAPHPQPRGEWSADRRTRLLRRACEARQPRERNADRPVATGTPSRRSTVAIFGRRPAPASPAVAPDARSGLSAPGHKSRRTGSRTSRDAVRAATAGRHSSLRLQDRLRRRPSMSEHANLILQIRYVVKC